MTESYIPQVHILKSENPMTITKLGLWELNRLKVTGAGPSQRPLCFIRKDQRASLYTLGHSENMAVYKLSQSPYQISQGLELGLPNLQS